MTRNEILLKVASLLAEILDEDSVALSDATEAPDIPGWDSFVNINLMIAIEKALSIKFMAHEIEELRNVGDVLDTIEHKLMRGK